IQVGADADIAIIHPRSMLTVSPSTMETNADWSPYDGWQLAGFSRTTLSRGEVIVDGYKVVGKEGRGQWLPRTSAGLAPAGADAGDSRAASGHGLPMRPMATRPAIAR